ncbi:hypothetical protein [Salinibacter sp.]|uniref:hypothetical protein n=1 Tax=Salinibacter sp. TaxID=2065818 RepID=UPI0021E7936A|nr:hypothetical protein [Salinibacter sp.]
MSLLRHCYIISRKTSVSSLESIKSWANDWQPVLWIIFTLITILGGWQYFDKDESLKITFDKTPLRIPDIVTGPITKESQLYERAKMADSLKERAKELSNKRKRAANYLKDINYYVRVVLYNESSKTLENTKIKIPNVTDYSGIGVSGDLFTSDRLRYIKENVEYDSYNEIVSFPIIKRFPPEGTLVIYLWGNVSSSVDLSQPVQAVYDNGSGEVTYTAEVTGINAYIYNNSLLILTIFLLLNLFFFASLVDKYSQEDKDEDT